MTDNGIVQTTNTSKIVFDMDYVYERSEFKEIRNVADNANAKDFKKVYMCHEKRYTIPEYLTKTLVTK